MTRLYILADDSMQGRETGTLGNVKATTYIAGELRKIGLQPAGDDGTYFQTIQFIVRKLNSNASTRISGAQLARNVVAILPGSDPVLRHQYVALGAHSDHLGTTTHPVEHDSLRVFNHFARPLGAEAPPEPLTPATIRRIDTTLARLRRQDGTLHHPRPDSIYNGADDDASGSVALLEIAQYLASLPIKPRRSILFVWHTGEEEGLLGSTWFTDHPTVPRDSIVAQLTMDMIGRGDASDHAGGGPHHLQLIGSRRLSTELGDLVERVNRTGHHDFVFDYSLDAPGHPARVYCRSDHYSYARYGIPVTFFTTGIHPDYHQVTDEAEYIDYAHLARVASLVSDVAVHVADLDRRLAVDHPKPDPHGSCKQ